jgi:hypothetical protein
LSLRTEFEFTLPKGYVDDDGKLHREGIMKLATAADEILPARDSRVQSNPAYLVIILLSRVIIKLGTLTKVSPGVIESLFVGDLAFLKGFYQQINGNGTAKIATVCPNCEHRFEVEIGNNDLD